MLNGEKWFVTGPDDTDFMIFHCHVVDGDQRLPTLFLVDDDTSRVGMSWPGAIDATRSGSRRAAAAAPAEIA